MKEHKVTCTFVKYNSAGELSTRDQELLDEAQKAAKDAYAPYSGFHVGAALRLKSGKIIRGNNQENVAYPSGLCAERVAIFYASAAFPGERVESIAITALTDHFEINDPVTPCGSCRQVMAETEKNQGTNIRILMKSESGSVLISESASCLLPLMFKADGLKSKE